MNWEVASEDVRAEQYSQQTEGWRKSSEHLRGVVTERGPFDGILGFSQAHLHPDFRALFARRVASIYTNEYSLVQYYPIKTRASRVCKHSYLDDLCRERQRQRHSALNCKTRLGEARHRVPHIRTAFPRRKGQK